LSKRAYFIAKLIASSLKIFFTHWQVQWPRDLVRASFFTPFWGGRWFVIAIIRYVPAYGDVTEVVNGNLAGSSATKISSRYNEPFSPDFHWSRKKATSDDAENKC
jgi:hypothetical protein